MATNVPNMGQKQGGRPSGGRTLPQGATVGVQRGGGVPANVRPLLAPIAKGRNSTTNSQPG